MPSTLQAGAMAVARASRDVLRDKDDPAAKRRLAEARQNLAEARIAEAVRKAVETAPPISPDAASRLSVLLFSNTQAAA